MKIGYLTLSFTLLTCCTPSKPIGSRLVSDAIITRSDRVAVIHDDKKFKEKRLLYKVPTNSLNDELFDQAPSKPEQFMIDMINLRGPGHGDLHNADYERTVGKESAATIYILRPKNGEWSFVLWEGI